MSLSELSIRRPVFAWMLMAALILFGAVSFHRLGISQLPDVDFPVVSVSLSLPGAAPAVVESQVLDPMEDAVMEISGIRSVNSSAQQNGGSISIEFELDRNIDEAMQEVQNKISQVQNLMPLNLYPPVVRKSNPEDIPIMWIALSADDPNTPPIDLMIYARNHLFNIFSTVSGVGNIALGGYVDPALRVWVDTQKLDKYNLTSDDLLAAILYQHVELPAGRLENKKNESNLRVLGEASSPKEFGLIPINQRAVLGPNYRLIRFQDVASIEEGTVDVRKVMRNNRKRAVGLGIIKQHGSNAVDVATAVRAKLAEIQPLIPKGFHVDARVDNTRFIKQSVDELVFMLGLSALLTSLVCYLFLGSITSTINVLFAIPTSIVGTFTALYFFNFTLNTFTMLGLSLAIGIVVDDAIMMLENIVRHRELGEGKFSAALKGSEEITFAAVAATVAVVAIFMPVVFMKGAIGRFFFQYGVTVTVAVLLSLLEALTLTPMRCARYLTVNPNPKGLAKFIEHAFAKLTRGYQSILVILLKHRWKTLLVALLLFLGSLGISKLVPGEMMPAQDQSMFLMRFKLPVGSSLPYTDKRIKIAEDYLFTQPEVQGAFVAVGGFGGDAVNQAMAFVTLTDPKTRKLSQAAVMEKVRKDLNKLMNKDVVKTDKPPPPGVVPPGGMEVVAQDLSLRGFAASRGFPVEFILQGPDWNKLTETTNKVMDAMRKSGFVVNVNTDVQPGMPEVQITPNRNKLARRGIALTTVTGVINALIGGAILNGQTEYPKDGHRYQIELRLTAAQRDRLPQLKQIKLRNNRGEIVPLADLVDIQTNPSLTLISRLNRSRAITVYASPSPGHSQQEAMAMTEKIARSNLPKGYSIKLVGGSQSFKESFQSLIFAMILGLVVSYMVLASQFDSFIHPITVLMALPFSISGAFLGLWVGHQSLNMYSLIGFILLMGIVKKNSILLVDFTNQCRDKTSDVTEALLMACPVRLRPIIMTSMATIAGALPEALSIGPGSETTVPMATAIIGGVLASTFLTLFVVPCVYSLFAKLERPDPLTVAEALRKKNEGQVAHA